MQERSTLGMERAETNVSSICGEFRIKRKRLKNKFIGLITDPYSIATIIIIAVLGYLIIVPLWEMLVSTFKLSPRDAMRIPEATAGQFTTYYWERVFNGPVSKSMFYRPLGNSLLTSLVVSVASIILGGLMAWILTRTDIPYKKFFSFMVILPYMLPSWSKALAWITIFKNDKLGGYPGIFQYLFNVSPPDAVSYGPLPIIITATLHYYVFTYLLMSSALSSMSSDLEEMAEVCGANRFTILRKVVFPLVVPAILSAVILTFSKAIGNFGIAAYLGLKVQYFTLPTMIRANIKNLMTEQAYILAISLIVIACFAVYLNQRAIGARKSYVTIGGKGSRKNEVCLGKAKMPILILVSVFIFIAAIVPLLVITIQSFMLRDGIYSFSNLTTHYWFGESNEMIADGEPGIFKNPMIWRSIYNTLKLAIACSSLATIVGSIVGYIISRGQGKTSGKVVEQLSFLPFLIPSIAFGAIYLSMFSKPQLFIPSLYGTFTLLVLVSTIKYIPFAVRSGTSTMIQIGYELEEAAMIEGVSWFERFTKIILPLSKKGFFSGFLLVFISAMKELDLLVLLVTPDTRTLTCLTFAYTESGFQQFGNAIMVVIAILIILVYLFSLKLGADVTEGMGG